MSKPYIYITRKIPETILASIQNDFEYKMWPEEEIPVPREVLLEEIKKADGVFSLLTEKFDSQLMDEAPKLKIIANMAVGYDNIDIKEATKRNILVTNTPGVLTETTADLTFALLMATARRLIEAVDYIRQDKWKSWYPMQLTGQDIYESTLGIIGMGAIGTAVARRAKGFGMRILYHNRRRKEEVEIALGAEYRDKESLLKEADFVCLLTPLNAETYHLIGEKELNLMKSSAILINSARGGLVDNLALYQALKEKRIWAAGLDVFEDEPIDSRHMLLELPNVVTLPHIGSASIKTRLKMAELAMDNLRLYLSGQKPLTPVNPEIL